MNLHQLLKSRLELAKKFTKDFHDDAKLSVKDYKADKFDGWANEALGYDELAHSIKYRYRYTSPLIFTTHEAMTASLFDQPPSLIIKQRGEDDYDNGEIIQAAYEYLVDKLGMEYVMTDAAWWFILIGYAAGHVSYKNDSDEVPIYDEITGEQMTDEMGQAMTRMIYKWDDPIVEIGDPFKEYYSPESKYSVKGDKIPYYFIKKLMDVEEIKQVYKKTVEADAVLEVSDKSEADDIQESDVQRAKTWFYYGEIPRSNRGEVPDWRAGAEYFIVMTEKKIVHKERIPEKYCRLLKWYGPPNEFFGFGIGKVLRQFQQEKSIRRGQQVRYADVAAYPKILIPAGVDYDPKVMNDPRANVSLVYDGESAPSYLSPPDLSNVLTITEEAADRDAQQASGMMDISAAKQESTIKTATGQSIFAEAAERRMRKAKKIFVQWYKELMVLVLKQAQQNWEESKITSITGEDGKRIEIELSRDSLKDIDFDRDVDIDPETVSVNKDVLRAQAVELYNMAKDDPQVDRKSLFKDLIKDGFGKSDPDRYVKDAEVEPGTVLVDQATGQPYTVDESGELVSQDQAQEMSNPTGNPNVPTSPSGIMGQINR